MEKSILISVIVPVYNVEKYIDECLKSLLVQTYEPIEVIMVDDGSTDSSGAICDKYADQYSNFHVFHKENAGLGMARNTGMDYMRGDLVTFLDSDDFLEPDCIGTLYEGLAENNVDMCKGGFRKVIDGQKVKSIRGYKDEVFEGKDARRKLLPKMVGSLPDQRDSIEMSVCGAIYNAGIIKKHNIRFLSEREFISEDLVFNIDYMQHAVGACLIEYIGYNYRLNNKSLTTSYRKDRFEACKRFYLAMKEKLKNLGYDEMTIFRLDRSFFIYIRGCIAQENRQKSGYHIKECLKRINTICNDQIVQTVIASYPKQRMGFSQKVFLNLVQYKKKRILYILMALGI